MKATTTLARSLTLAFALAAGAGLAQAADAEVTHFQGRDHCVEHVRKTLSAERFAELSRLHLAGLR